MWCTGIGGKPVANLSKHRVVIEIGARLERSKRDRHPRQRRRRKVANFLYVQQYLRHNQILRADAMEDRTWNGAAIPPAEITPCGHLTDTPEKFYLAACEEADRIDSNIGLHDATAILDIGCGAGRLPIGLLARQSKFSFYLGIDVARDRVDWCAKTLSPLNPRLQFQLIDMHNARYNPDGQSAFDLALPPSSFDIIYLYSVFTHLIEADVRFYLDQIARLLRPGGVCFTTMFVADGVPPVMENPAGFGPFKWSGPLHCVLYERGHWHAMLESAKLKIVRELPHVNVDQQTGYFLVHADYQVTAPAPNSGV